MGKLWGVGYLARKGVVFVGVTLCFCFLSGQERVTGVSVAGGGDHGLHVAHPAAGLQLPAQLPPARAR